MEHPKAIGDRTTLAVMQALDLAGYSLAVPFGENVRYDLVIDDGERLFRVQCKTGRLRQGAVRFAACSTYHHHAQPLHWSRDYLGQIDYFAVYCPETTGVYLVPIEDLDVRTKGALRVTPSRNGQRRGIHDANRYEVGRVRTQPTQAPRATSGAK
jgi:PD-(D/E)XK endonuclease